MSKVETMTRDERFRWDAIVDKALARGRKPEDAIATADMVVLASRERPEPVPAAKPTKADGEPPKSLEELSGYYVGCARVGSIEMNRNGKGGFDVRLKLEFRLPSGKAVSSGRVLLDATLADTYHGKSWRASCSDYMNRLANIDKLARLILNADRYSIPDKSNNPDSIATFWEVWEWWEKDEFSDIGLIKAVAKFYQQRDNAKAKAAAK